MEPNEGALQLLSTLEKTLNLQSTPQVMVVIVQINHGQTAQYTRLIEGEWEDIKPIQGAPVIDMEPEGQAPHNKILQEDDEEAAAAPARAQDHELQSALRSAVGRRRRTVTPPGELAKRYQRLQIEAFDGERFEVAPRYTRHIETTREVEQTEATKLAKAILSEDDARADGLFRRVLRRSVKEASRADLGLLSRVFLGRGSPADIEGVLALVDRYQIGAFSREERAAALAEYYQTHIGLSPEGLALQYFKLLHGANTEEVTLQSPREDTDALSVGDFVCWPGGQVALIERPYNLLSQATRIEVLMLGEEDQGGLVRRSYKLRQTDTRGVFLATYLETSDEVRIFSPF